MSAPPRSIALVKVGSNSHKNRAIAAFLAARFPEWQLEVTDVVDGILKRRPGVLLRSLVEAVLTYGGVIVRQRRNPMDFVCRTRAAQMAISRWANDRLANTCPAFVFQNQSLFNARAKGAPFFLYTDHTYRANARYRDRRPSLPVPSWWPLLEAEFYAGAGRIFTTSRFARTSIVEDYGVDPETVECVYSGANVPGEPRGSIEKKSFHRRVLFVGIDWVRKGGPNLLEAFVHVRKCIPDAELWIVGCRPASLPEGVEAFGYLPPQRLAEFYRQCSVFCLPTHRDSAGIAFTEAALHGLPSIACDVGGVSERVVDQRTGYLVPAGDSRDLAARLLQLLGDPALTRSMGLAAWDHANGTFTWEAVGEKIENGIRRALHADALMTEGLRR